MTTQTVREIALEDPRSIRVFEQFGIDYCCGGRKPLAEACAATNVAIDEVLAALARATLDAAPAPGEWDAQPLTILARHIVDTHHAYIARETPRLAMLAAKVVNRHGDTLPELLTIQAALAELTQELSQHCAKEEIVLFPYIARLEAALATGDPAPQGCFGSVTSPIAMMTKEHDDAGALLAQLRRLSNGFTPPPGACPTFHAFYTGLREFEQDLHHHIHLENNILFPRAIALEASNQPTHP